MDREPVDYSEMHDHPARARADMVTGPVSRQLDGQVGFGPARKQVEVRVWSACWDQVRTPVRNQIYDQAREEHDG